MANKNSIVNKLPAVFRTITEEKFFAATVDQLFSKKSSEKLTGFIGRRSSGYYDPLGDFYLPEPNKERTHYQLEPVAVSKNPETLEKTNILFYQDLVGKIRSLGGDVSNHDRLFESNIYSYSPPINVDMYLNFRSYSWLPDRLAVFVITGVNGADLLGLENTSVPYGSNPDVELFNEMRIQFMSDPAYPSASIYAVSGVGDSIVLTEEPFEELVKQENLMYPWDAINTDENLDNRPWDNAGVGWDKKVRVSPRDYITIERGATDLNAWSRTNKWYHVDLITKVVDLTGSPYPLNARPGIRPIIEFSKNMHFYNSGINFFDMASYVVKSTEPYPEDENDPYIMPALEWDDIDGEQLSVIQSTIVNITESGADYAPLLSLEDGDTILFRNHSLADTRKHLWVVTVTAGVISLGKKTPLAAAAENDIVILNDGDLREIAGNRAETYFYNGEEWKIVDNQKAGVSQPPKFIIYDIEGNAFDNEFLYPNNNFRGSKIFSYKVNTDLTAIPDDELGFELTYRNSPSISDIIFENNIMSDQYIYTVGADILDIDGYPFYRLLVPGDDQNDNADWTFVNIWKKSDETSKQRVIDEHVVTEPEAEDPADAQDTFIISVTPHADIPDNIDVLLNGHFLTYGDDFTFDDTSYHVPVIKITKKLELNDAIRALTFTHDALPEDSIGYFEIPSQLEVNPNNEEIKEFSFGDLVAHMKSIITNQIGFEGDPLSSNNYRETAKDTSLGTFVVQNESPLLKTMLVSSSAKLDLVTAIRFAQNEYTTFRGNIQKTVKQMMDRDFVADRISLGQTLFIDEWVEEALKILSKSRMFSNAFAYSHMVAHGGITFGETFVSDGASKILSNYIDLTDVKNEMYVYRVEGNIEKLLLIDVDYTVSDTSDIITITPASSEFTSGDTMAVRLYDNPAPAYLPSSPAKLGCTPVYQPRLIEDGTYSSGGVYMILGHDGSKTPALGQYQTVAGEIETVVMDHRDEVLLEIERRIYNGIPAKFRTDYDLLLRAEHIRPGKFRTPEDNRYTRKEYYEKITESYFSKWTAEYNLDFRLNEFYNAADHKTWNYSSQTDQLGGQLPGHWRGIFDYYYDTQTPAETPWEMLGFTIEPKWWETEYGSAPWGNGNSMWADLEAGLIRQGNRAGTDSLFARPDLNGAHDWRPVDAIGDVRTIADIFDLSAEWAGTIGVGSLTEEAASASWVYGDGATIEYVWQSSSEHCFSQLEFLYLMKPSELGEKMWNPLVTGIKNGQFLNVFTNSRSNTTNDRVHGEVVDQEVIVTAGYQVFISDRLLFLDRDVTAEFGDKVRSLTVNLAHKMAGFSNKDTMRVFLESTSASSLSNSLLIPENNYQLLTYESPSVREYVYSGVIIRALDSGFSVHGYDLLSLEFKVMDKSPSSRMIQVSEGGTPDNFKKFEFGVTYSAGDIIQNNSVFYQAAVTHEANSFISTNWVKLQSLPTVGGINVTYYPDRINTFTRVQYGTVFDNAQDIFDFLIGYGKYLELEGWEFSTVNQYNEIENWLTYAKKFLFWASSEWQDNNVLFLSPNSEQPTLRADVGYPRNIERMSNGVYSILNKFGVSINPANTVINRDDSEIQVIPTTVEDAIYYLRVESSETEHILLVDNRTDFEDVVYEPLFRARQNRLKFIGTKTTDWFGKREAGGYLIRGNSLIPNLENQTTGIRDLYNTETSHDNVDAEEAARHLIGHETRDYLDGLEVADDIQFSFYQGFIRQKGTHNAINKLLRSNKVTDKNNIRVVEEWAIKQNEFGGLVDNITVEVAIDVSLLRSDPQIIRLTHETSEGQVLGEVKIFNREEEYDLPPKVLIDVPRSTLSVKEPATAIAILGDDRKIEKIEIINSGRGYTFQPVMRISDSTVTGEKAYSTPARNTSTIPNRDRIYGVMHAYVPPDPPLDEIIEINIADASKWLLKPKDQDLPFGSPMTDNTDFQIPNAGYASLDDVDYTAFAPAGVFNVWLAAPMETVEAKRDRAQNPEFRPVADTCWVANNLLGTWNVYKIYEHIRSRGNDVKIIDDGNGFANLSMPIGDRLPDDPKQDLLTAFQREWVDSGEMHADGTPRQIQGDVNLEIGIVNLATFTEGSATHIASNELYQYVRVFPAVDPTAPAVYALYDTTNTRISFDVLSDTNFVINVFKGMRFDTMHVKESWIVDKDIFWIDNVNPPGITKWVVFREAATEGTRVTLREQEPMIWTDLYDNAFLRDKNDNETLALLSVLDPFKDLIPGVAEQNIDFKTLTDPARYNVSDSDILFDPSNTFGPGEVGKTWWDLSTSRVLYYEQPANYPESAYDTVIAPPPPPAIEILNIDISNDTGASASDFITNIALQDITADLSAALVAGDTLFANSGSSWTDITSSVSGTSIVWNAVTLSPDTNSLQFKVVNPSGDGPVATQEYTLDISPSSITIGDITISNDTGISGTDLITLSAVQDIAAKLIAQLAAGDILYGSTDAGANWTVLSPGSVIGTDVNWIGAMLVEATVPEMIIQFRIEDLAGNFGPVYSQAYVLDTTASTIIINTIDIEFDTGPSDTDFITATAIQNISATMTASLAAGDILYGSIDAGANWTILSPGSVSGTNVNWIGATLIEATIPEMIIQFRIDDAAGNVGIVYTQPYELLPLPTTTVISIVEPSADLVPAVGQGDGKWAAFEVNNTKFTIFGLLSSSRQAWETVMASPDNGATWVTAGGSGTSWAVQFLATTAGSNTILVKVVNDAGDGPTTNEPYSMVANTIGNYVTGVSIVGGWEGPSTWEFHGSANRTMVVTLDSTKLAGQYLSVSTNGWSALYDATSYWTSGNTITMPVTLFTTGTHFQVFLSDLHGNRHVSQATPRAYTYSP